MNKGRLIGGIVCLALALVIGVLSFVLPEDSMVFYAGEENLRWVPAVVLGVVGVVLLSTAGIGRVKAAAGAPREEIAVDEAKAAQNKRLESIAWSCFLIMLGGFLLVPQTVVAKGVWSIGVGLIMLGLNAARYHFKIKMSGFTTFLGVLSVLGGVLQLVGLKEIEGAFLLIILGAFLLVKPWLDRRKLFGKAEEA